MTETDRCEVSAETPSPTRSGRRRSPRVEVNLPGRYMLEDGSEHPCICVDVSVSGLRLRAAQSGPWGSRVVAYVEGVGRIEGYIVRRAPGWFALENRVTARKGERVQERIAGISDSAEISDRRQAQREPVRRKASLFTLDGRGHAIEIADVSREGAAIWADAILEIGDRVRLDSRRARVARVFPGGAALRFENWTDETWPRRDGVAEPAKPRARRA